MSILCLVAASAGADPVLPHSGRCAAGRLSGGTSSAVIAVRELVWERVVHAVAKLFEPVSAVPGDSRERAAPLR